MEQPPGSVPEDTADVDEAWHTFGGASPRGHAADQQEGGGAGDSVHGAPPSPGSRLEALLSERPLCSLDRLLDDEDFAVEFHSGNAAVKERLSGQEAVLGLVRCATRGGGAEEEEGGGGAAGGGPAAGAGGGAAAEDDEARQRLRHQRPYVAAELLASGTEEMMRSLASDAVQAELWGFFSEVPRDDPSAPVLAGYFCSTAATAMARQPAQVAAYLRQNNPGGWLESFMAWSDLRCVVELLATLLCTEGAALERVIPVEGLLARLVSCFSDDDRPAAHEHAALLADTLIARACAGELSFGKELLQQLASQQLVAQVADQALSTSNWDGSACRGAAATLASAVSHLHQLQPSRLGGGAGGAGDLLQAGGSGAGGAGGDGDSNGSRATAAEGSGPLSGQQLELARSVLVAESCARIPTVCELLDALAAQDGSLQVSQAERERQVLVESIRILLGMEADGGSSSAAEQSLTRLGELAQRSPDLQEALAQHSAQGAPDRGQLLAALRRLAQRKRQERAQPLEGASVATVVEVMSLLVLLAKTGCRAFFDMAFRTELLQRCLLVLVSSSWSSILHNALLALLLECLSSPGHGRGAALALLGVAPAVERIFAALAAEAEARKAWAPTEETTCRRRSPTNLGCLGHVRCLCACLQEQANRSPEVASVIAGIDGWHDIVLADLEAMGSLQGEPLGGPLPPPPSMIGSGFDCLETVRAAMQDRSMKEVELTPEDLRDLREEAAAGEEDTETEQVLEHFQASQLARRRPKLDAASDDGPTALAVSAV